MKQSMFIGVFLSLVLLGCPMQPGISEEEKKMQETLNDLTSATPTAEASPELRGKKYVSGELLCSFAASTNTFSILLVKAFKPLFYDQYGTYSMSGNTLSLDFSKQIVAQKNMNREVWVRGTAEAGKAYIASLTEQLKDPGLSAEKRAELEKKRDDAKTALAKLEARIQKGEFTLVDINQSDELMDTQIEYSKESARACEAINPITATLSTDRKTLTLSKRFSGFEKKADNTYDYTKPPYLENVVFTLQE